MIPFHAIWDAGIFLFQIFVGEMIQPWLNLFDSYIFSNGLKWNRHLDNVDIKYGSDHQGGLHFHLTNHFQRHFSWILASNGTNPSEFVVTFHPISTILVWSSWLSTRKKNPFCRWYLKKTTPQAWRPSSFTPAKNFRIQHFPAMFWVDKKNRPVFLLWCFLRQLFELIKLRFRRDRLKPFGNNAPPRHWKACQPLKAGGLIGAVHLLIWLVGSWCSWWLNQPLWKICGRQIGNHLPQVSGVKIPKNVWSFTT